MTKSYHYLIVLIIAAAFIAACAATPAPTPPPTTALPASAVPGGVPTSPPPTSAPTVVLPTPTALSLASPSPHATDGGTPMPASQPTTGETQIRVIIGNASLTGRLWDNATARDLTAQLPLTLTFSDYGGQEKLAPLPRKLSMEGVPPGADPLPREIGYYAPAGVIVFYYSDVGYFSGIVRIGRFNDNIDAITNQTSDFVVRIEPVN